MLEACAAERVAVVPFGGGTSVVGGVQPVRAAFDGLVALDLRRLRSVEIDERSLVARLGPGLRGPEVEQALGERGLTLGHFPQSFEYATIGGFAATRSAGQASSGYGRFDDLVTSIRLVTPVGELATLDVPHTAAGPSLRELAVGSEGVLGVITEVGVRVRPAPAERRYEAWVVSDFAGGQEIVRTLAQAAALPDVIRVSDERRRRPRWASPASRERAAAPSTPICASAVAPTDASSSPAGRAPPSRPSAAAPSRLGSSAPGAPFRSARARGARGCEVASRGRICARRCSTSATWSRRWRRRTPGRTSNRTTARSRARSTRRCEAGRGLRGHVPPLARLPRRRLAVLHLHRPSPGGRRARAVARGQGRRLRGDRLAAGDDHPPPRDRHRPRPLHAGRGGRAGHRRPALR